MKCPNCGNNHKKSAGMRCTCGYNFVFNPGTDKGLTDGKFAACINDASNNGTYFFTENQLYSVFCRHLDNPFPLVGCFVVAVITGLILFFIDDYSKYWPFAAGWIILGLVIKAFSFFSTGYERKAFHDLLHKWVSQKGKIEKLIEKPQLDTPPPEYKEKDIYDYGVERILIVQRKILVDLLVLNNFHANERVLVISRNGYPDYLVPIAQKVLNQSQNPKVFLLHDSIPSYDRGRMLSGALTFPETCNIVDLGLFPNDIKKLPVIKAVKPKPEDSEVPVDLIPYRNLAAILSSTLNTGIPIADVIIAGTTGDSGGDDVGGSYG